ncbi:hypothetical protein M7I_4645 [Glarea lozoyensis 74030]|uniref:Uncharacterized protein n=1 Tax=Glarea lozoyensis (strain ATCC 74030 / MF5533) TaxID=1104152 RepID=H0EPQ9_GLAL7|nr:hypothetical protein M7I_4645 [Glarea lozoyensis 74030]
MAILSTLSGWVAVIALGGGYYYYVKEKKSPVTAAKQAINAIDTKESKPKKAPAKSEKAAKKKTQQPASKNEKEADQGFSTAVSNDRDDEVDNKEFARQISNIKSGHVPTSKAKTEKKQKSVKQSKAQESKTAAESSDNADVPSSATGVNSPELKASADTTPVTSGGVSDMLEAPSSGPSVLKITESTNPAKPKKSKPQTFEAVESKKARQNRKKAEAAKEARADEEKARKVLEEKQRRTAREAEGRAAKDGSVFMASKAPSQSAWVPPATTPEVSGTTKGANGTNPADTHIQLLDTYEAPSKNAETSSQGQTKGGEWQKTLPSEEEQVRIAIEESDEWQTVKGKKQQEKRKAAAPAPVEPVAPAKEKADFSTVAASEPTDAGQKWKNTSSHTSNGVADEKEEDFEDSEWEVA